MSNTFAAEPSLGDWYVVPQSVIEVARQYAPHVPHRWIVVSRPYLGEVDVVLRTTTPGYDSFEHSAHPSEHESTCRIDKPGHLCSPARKKANHLILSGQFSCTEPDPEIVEAAQGYVLPPKRTTGRRRR